MNSFQANNLDLPDLLSRLGHEPVAHKKGGDELWYKSPFREEKEASFHISKGNKWAWVWKDFGDEGGTVIDFIMRYQGHRDLKKVLEFLDDIYGGIPVFKRSKKKGKQPINQPSLFSFHGQSAAKPPKISEKPSLEFISANNITHPLILSYLKGRALPEQLCLRYLLEIKYRNRSKERDYFAFGMKNQGGGYEIRAASDAYQFKSALITRDITLIGGSSSKEVAVFEGMTDFLSYLVLSKREVPVHDCLIMHSLSSFNKSITAIFDRDYETIYSFLDNNPSGLEHTRKFQEKLGGRVVPQSALFAPHIDLNDALRAGIAWPEG